MASAPATSNTNALPGDAPASILVAPEDETLKTSPSVINVDVPAPTDVFPVTADRGVMSAGRNPWTFLTLSYLNQMMKTSIKRPLEADDIPLLKEEDRAAQLAKCLEPYNIKVADYLAKKKLINPPESSPSSANSSSPSSAATPKLKIPGLIPIIFGAYGHYFWWSAFFQGIRLAALLYLPFVLQALLVFLQGGKPEAVPFGNSGIGLSLLLFLITLVKIVGELTNLQLIRNFQYDAFSVLKIAIFEKFLKISNKASKEFSEGRIISMVNVDAEQFALSLLGITDLFFLPVQIGLTIYFLTRLIGVNIYPAAIVLVACLIVLIPVGGLVSKFMKAYMTAEDGRVKTVREILLGMKIVKLRAEEDFRMKDVDVKRDIQLSAIFRSLVLLSILITLMLLPPILMPVDLPVASILLYSRSTGGLLDPSIIFPALIYFGQLLDPLQG
ncbi:Multidrug resistance-associated protein 6, partial [Dinochytrium kinnereticum]